MIALVAAVLLSANALSASKHTDAPPPELAPAVRELIAAPGARVTASSTTLDFWWVKTLPQKEAAAPSWQNVEEGTLVGAV
ncbi:MAG: hypothetical protein ACRD09_08475, partial [Vicinamibacterales bacterium]